MAEKPGLPPKILKLVSGFVKHVDEVDKGLSVSIEPEGGAENEVQKI